MRSCVVSALAMVLLTACGPEPKPVVLEPAKIAEAPTHADESRRFTTVNLVKTEVVPRELMATFMPGGTLARYRKGKKEYEMFVAKCDSATNAAILLLDWHKDLAGSKYVPSFGGYFGLRGRRPLFVFSKGAWIAGIVGLAEKDADVEARVLAAHLD